MLVKRLLIVLPLVLGVTLLQSYFWVPTYDSQSVGGSDRLRTYIEGSSGDAKLLNPILNADSASSQIVNLTFDGLLDYDENLKLRPRLATDWTITEEAYLIVRRDRRFPDGRPVTTGALIDRIRRAIANGRLGDLSAVIQSVEPLPASRRTEIITVPVKKSGERPTFVDVPVTVRVPERVRLNLEKVDQDLFEKLTPILGQRYASDFRYERYIELPSDLEESVRTAAEEMFSTVLPVQEHNPIILFHLRQDVRFHDGHEFDSGDVKFTYESIINPKNLSPRTPDFEPIKRIEVLDRYTVRVVYKRLFSPAINAWGMGMLPEHLLNEEALEREMDAENISGSARKTFNMRESRFNRNPIGTGPFRFVEWHSDEFIYLVRNEDYWDGPPEYHHYYYRIIPDLLTQEVEFRAGAIDSYGALPHQAKRYREDPEYQTFSTLQYAYTYIGYNIRRPLFSDPRVRRALGMAINVDEFIKYHLYGEGEPTTGPYPKPTDWYDHSLKPLPYDPEGAVRILNELGWEENQNGWLEKDGKVFEFNLITNNNPIRNKVMTIAQNAWRKIGVKCNTQYFEWAVFLEDFVTKGQFDALVLGWSMGFDPDLYQIWHSSQAGPHQLNFIGYKNPEADRLIVRIRQEYDRDRQVQYAHQLHRLIYQDQPYTFLYAPLSTLAMDKKIVMVTRPKDGEETYAPIKPTKTGRVGFYFNQWRKLELTPDF